MSSIIKVENLGKQYRIGALQLASSTFREMLSTKAVETLRRLRRRGVPANETIWALKDVTFEVEPGEIVGIIGHNGAGKSTLLKILSRIAEQSTGSFELYGRVGSLLEIGTGFHQDLTGRDNIFLNGAILGMTRREIKRKFDEIVAFSEIEQFIDTPVKFYSSGMYLRLAFSVAVHLEPEILVMDEVLAVGDAAFQQKCLDKMHEIRQQEGRTILFVSHSLPAVTRLCSRVIQIHKGRIISDGGAHQVVNTYLDSSLKITAERSWFEDDDEAPGSDIVRMRRVRVVADDGSNAPSIDIRRPVGLELTYDVLLPGHVLTPCFDLLNSDGVHLFAVHDLSPEWRRTPRPAGRYVSTVWIPGNVLSEGTMLVHAALLSYIPGTVLHTRERNVVAFQVIDTMEGDSARGDFVGPVPGVVRPILNWTTQFDDREQAAQRIA